MTEFLVGVLLVNVAAHMVASGLAGSIQSRRVGAHRWQGTLVGGLLPWVGLLVLAAVYAGRPRQWVVRPARSGAGLAGVLLLVAGGGAVAASMFAEWGSLSGSALQFSSTLRANAADNPQAVALGFGTAAVLAGLGVAAWLHGGLRFTLVAAFLTTLLATTFVNVVIVSDVLVRVAQGARGLSGGLVNVQLFAGPGLMAAFAGCVAGYAGSLLVLLHRPLTVAEANARGLVRGRRAPGALAPVAAAASRPMPHTTPSQTPQGWGDPYAPLDAPNRAVSDEW